MKERNGYLFLAEQREAKLTQFTGRLDRLSTLVDWQGLSRAVNDATGREGLRPKGGRPPYPTEALLKIVVLQQLYGNLSDEEMEYCLLDRMSWQSFTGLTGHRHLPDARTIWAFKELLAKGGGAEALFEIVGQQLAAAGHQSEIHERNKALSKIRARVEHVFGDWAQSSGKTLRCIGQVRARAQIIIRACVYNLRRWVTLDRRGACSV